MMMRHKTEATKQHSTVNKDATDVNVNVNVTNQSVQRTQSFELVIRLY